MPTDNGDDTKETHSVATDESDLLYKYYLHQWEQVRHCENIRSNITLQLLTIVGASTAGFFYAKHCPGIQLALSSVVIAVGILSYFAVRALEKASNVHIKRARAARAKLPSINAIANSINGFFPLARYFLSLNMIVVAFGLALLVHAWSAAPRNGCVPALACVEIGTK